MQLVKKCLIILSDISESSLGKKLEILSYLVLEIKLNCLVLECWKQKSGTEAVSQSVHRLLISAIDFVVCPKKK